MTSRSDTPRRSLRLRILRYLVLALAVLALLDMISFANRADKASLTAPDTSNADAVVALTGGGARIARSAEIAQDLNVPLFVSGVNPDVASEDVARAAGVDETYFDCCVTLGRQARTTAENGKEAAAWAREHGHDQIVLVTSSYHLERALLELQRAMPEASLIGYAVISPTIRSKNWWMDFRSAKRMTLEWAKWRVVHVRETLAGR